MAHELLNDNDMIYVTGQRKAVWHGLGVDVGEDALSVEDMFQQHPQLNYKAIKVALKYEGPDGNLIVSSRNAIIRPDTGLELGTCLSRYQIIQNEDALKDVINPIISSKEGIIQTAGLLKGGQSFWALMKLPGEIRINDDQVEKYLLFVNSFDGTSPMRVFLTSQVVVCHNTLSAAINNRGADAISIRHTTNANLRLQQATKLIGLTNKLYSDFSEAAKAMAEKTITQESAKLIIKTAFPHTATKEETGQANDTFDDIEDARKKLENQFSVSRKAEKAFELLETGKGMKERNKDGITLWSVLNAVTETVDHGTNYKSPNAQFEHALLDAGGAKSKRLAYDLCLDLVK